GPWLESDAELGSILVLPGIRLLNLPEPAALDRSRHCATCLLEAIPYSQSKI
ncbi:MAG: hypothetical protein HC878_00690, partial [Leptolyngbyaceae cyanobacterium SL_5_14]|nr:hypothetical protein [Leptolyngbyaceae cyanobacterium SL_5_14]